MTLVFCKKRKNTFEDKIVTRHNRNMKIKHMRKNHHWLLQKGNCTRRCVKVNTVSLRTRNYFSIKGNKNRYFFTSPIFTGWQCAGFNIFIYYQFGNKFTELQSRHGETTFFLEIPCPCSRFCGLSNTYVTHIKLIQKCQKLIHLTKKKIIEKTFD